MTNLLIKNGRIDGKKIGHVVSSCPYCKTCAMELPSHSCRFEEVPK